MPTVNPDSSGSPQATDISSLRRLFGERDDLLPLWIAEPYIGLAPAIREALSERALTGWYGYETRPSDLLASFWEWMGRRHGWSGEGLEAVVSPSVGTSMGVLIEELTSTGDGVILQPPVFTDFKPIVSGLNRSIKRNPLTLTDDGYRMDLDNLEVLASSPDTKLMILCNPHNPVGRVWERGELEAVSEICGRNGVFVISDEIHADLVLPHARFTPYATAASGTEVRWAATHGPIKTFGLAGVCDSLVVSDDELVIDVFSKRSSQLHLTRNNVFALSAFEVAYREGGEWLDQFISELVGNFSRLREGLPKGVDLVEPEGTYLAWLDFSDLGMDVPELASWLSSRARLALSPGHWFGREGAGFARMTVAVSSDVIDEAIERIATAVEDL